MTGLLWTSKKSHHPLLCHPHELFPQPRLEVHLLLALSPSSVEAGEIKEVSLLPPAPLKSSANSIPKLTLAHTTHPLIQEKLQQWVQIAQSPALCQHLSARALPQHLL